MSATTARRAGPPDEAGPAFLGLLVAGAAVWGAHQVLPRYWGAGTLVDPLGWLQFTLRNAANPSALDGAWLRLWQADVHHYLAALAAVALVTWGLVFVPLTGRSVRGAPAGLVVGGVVGVLAGLAVPRIPDAPTMMWVLAPPAGLFFFGAFGAALAIPPRGDALIRGAKVGSRRPRRASAGAVQRAIRKGQVCFAGTVLSAEAESTHVLAIGASGSGKSTAIDDLLATGVARGGAMVVADPGGEALARHWREGDRVLNPFDGRCAKWDLFSDLREDTDDDRVAAALLPASGGPEAERWTRRGRDLLAALMRRYRHLDVGGSDDFAHFLRTAGPDMMAELVAGTEAASLFAPGNERLRGSVLDELAPATRLLSRMAAVEGEAFSIRDWVRANEVGRVGRDRDLGGGRLWLPYRLNQLDSLRAAIGCWIGLAATEVTSLPRSDRRRVWFVADELDLLGLVPELTTSLTNGRKYGACFALGFQSIAQLRETYGENLAAVIEEQIGTKLILRCEGTGPQGTAEYASRLIGEREVGREEVSVSTGRGRAGSTSRAVRQKTERAVLPAELGQLENLTGYLRTAGSGAWRMVRLAPRKGDDADAAPPSVPASWTRGQGRVASPVPPAADHEVVVNHPARSEVDHPPIAEPEPPMQGDQVGDVPEDTRGAGSRTGHRQH